MTNIPHDFLGAAVTWQLKGERSDLSKSQKQRLTQVLHDATQQQLIDANEAGAAIYYCVNATDGQGRTKSHVTAIRALWVDWDIKPPDTSSLNARPTYAVQSSPGKLQAVWVLREPIPTTDQAQVRRWQAAEKALVAKLGGDPAAALLTQVLRAPGYRNNKYPEAPMVETIEAAGTLYTLDKLVAAFGLKAEAHVQNVQTVQDESLLPPEIDREAEFSAWLDRIPAPAEGSGERNAWYFKACAYALRDCAIDDTEWLADVLVAHSHQHHPRNPYDHGKLRDLIFNADRHSSGQRGRAVIVPNLIFPEAPTFSMTPPPPSDSSSAPVANLAQARLAKANANPNNSQAAAKVARYQAAVRQGFEYAQYRYRAVEDETGGKHLYRISEPGVLVPAEKDSLKDALLLLFEHDLAASEVSREVYPGVLAHLRAEFCVKHGDIQQFVFKSAPTDRWAWVRLGFDPDPKAACPAEFAEMMTRVADDEARSLILFMGSLLDLTCPRTQYLHLHGEGNDGKSTILELLGKVFGQHFCAVMRATSFADSHSTSILERARLVIFHDENNARFMSSGHFKALTGDDIATINPKNQALRTVRLRCRVLVASNNRPELNGSVADTRRCLPVHLKSFAGGEDIPFVRRLMTARNQVLQYCYAQWVEHQAANGYKIEPGAAAADEIRNNSELTEAEDLIKSVFDDSDSTAATLTPREALAHIRNFTNDQSLLTVTKRLLRARYKIVRRDSAGRADPKAVRTLLGLRYRAA